MAAKKKEVLTLSAEDIGIDLGTLDAENKLVVEVNLSLPPERKKGIILEGSDEEISRELVRVLREEEKIV